MKDAHELDPDLLLSPDALRILNASPDEPPFLVTDLKQWAYCPRVVYYRFCLPAIRPTTFKMDIGIEAGQREAEREARRSLARYGLEEGERHFNVYVASSRLGLRGQVDMVIRIREGDSGEIIPVDYKNTRKLYPHLELQLVAYGLLLQETTGLPSRRGFLYSIPLRRAYEVKFTARLLRRFEKTLHAMRKMLYNETMPPPTRKRGKCVACEFRRFCNDIW